MMDGVYAIYTIHHLALHILYGVYLCSLAARASRRPGVLLVKLGCLVNMCECDIMSLEQRQV